MSVNVATGELPPDVARQLERLTGARIHGYRLAAGGYTPALRCVIQTGGGSYFAKVGVTPLTAQFVRREIHVYRSVHGPFMPRCVAWDDEGEWPLLIIEDLSAAHWPPPWRPDRIEQVLLQIEAMHNTRAALEPYAAVNATHWAGWENVAADPEPFLRLGLARAAWLEAALPTLIEQEARCPTAGNSLTHWDLRSDNICLAGDRAIFVDWNLACLSNPRLDLGFWLPSLAYEGGPLPESILPDAPEVAAWVSGFFAARAGRPDIPDAPRVRWVQREQLQTALPWAIRALDLPPLAD